KASGTTPITFGATGTLPGGLTLTNGVLSGTPTTAGTFTGTFTASNGTTPNASQNFSIVINTPPTFAGYAFAAPYQKPTTVSLNKLQANASDADGDAITWSIPTSSSTNGGTVALQPDSILYTPATAFSGADSFSVTLTDARGAATIGTVTVTVGLASTVADGNPVGNAPRLTVLPGGNVVLTFQGIPFQPYQIQRTTNLATVAWSILDTVTASSVGTVTFTDTSPPTGSAFYRLAVP
ncbi:MAG: Ig-like domain-containing protein, partial [Verrucomicrobia bacterium]|nr:Ig-like domain-containing protein [Verrucomicrobiota bacterium]